MLNKTLPYFFALLLVFNEVKAADTSTIDQLVYQSWLATGAKQYDKARELAEHALTLAERDPDFPQLKLAHVLMQVASTHQRLNQLAVAIKYSRRVVDMVMVSPSADVQFRAFSLTHLAEVLTLAGDPVQAEASGAQALELVESKFGVNSRELIGPLGQLGVAYLEQGKIEQASQVLERAINISRFEPYTIGTNYQNLFTYCARLYRTTGQQEKAVEMENKVKSIATISVVTNVRPAVAKPVEATNESKR